MSRSVMALAIFASVRKALRNSYLHAETLMLNCFNVEELQSVVLKLFCTLTPN